MQTRVSCSLCHKANSVCVGECRSSSASPSTLALHQQVPEASWAAWNSSCHSSQILQAPAIRTSYPPCALWLRLRLLLCTTAGTMLNPWHAKRPVSAHHYTKLQHKRAADAVHWKTKENGSQLLTSGMNRVNLRRNRFIFRMVSQESLKQIARNLGY